MKEEILQVWSFVRMNVKETSEYRWEYVWTWSKDWIKRDVTDKSIQE